jgi:hypothetical protein
MGDIDGDPSIWRKQLNDNILRMHKRILFEPVKLPVLARLREAGRPDHPVAWAAWVCVGMAE